MKRKEEKGITLIALVVTIIVLLILAAVSLAMLTGENGILTQAKLSKSKTEEGGVREEVELAIQEIVLEKRYKEELTIRKIGEYLAEKLDGITVVETTDDKIKIEYKGYEIEITSNWKVKIIGKAGITVTYTKEPTEYAKDSVEIILNIQTREGVSVTSVIPEGTGVETIEANKRFKVTENKVYKFKLTDNSSNERTIQVPIDNIDQEAPKAQIEWITKMGITNSTLKAKVTIEDEKSGADLNNCKWVLKDSATPVGKDIANYTGGSITSEEGEIETGTVTEAKKYYMHVLVTDNVGNTEEYCSKEIEVKSGYAISTPQEFQNMKNDLAGNYYIVNDIDMKDFNFTTIPGNFTGTLDGQGYTISNLKISGAPGKENIGIFETIKGNVKISNLLIRNAEVVGQSYNVGIIAGEADFYAKPTTLIIERVGLSGSVKGTGNVSSFVGTSFQESTGSSVSFSDCYARCNLLSHSAAVYDAAGFIIDKMGYIKMAAERCYWSGTSDFSGRVSTFITYGCVDNNGNQVTHGNISVNKNCYYDKEKFPLNITHANTGTGLTTEQMKKQESYAGWDFENTWKMGEDGYPELRFDENT